MTPTTEAPAVSVVIPTYNTGWCIRTAIDSVLNQSCTDFELIVVDDGSTDDTAQVLAAYYGRIQIVAKVNGGLSSARNAGIAAARGAYVAFLDADDWWLPPKLERQLALMRSRPDLVFCSTAAQAVSPDGEKLGEWRCGNVAGSALESIFAVNAFVAGSGSAVLARRDALVRAGGFDETLRSLEDIDMWIRLSTLGNYACVDELLVGILKRPISMSGNLDVMRASAIRVMQKNRSLLPPHRRGSYWRHAYAGVLSDYAKWAWRSGRRSLALKDVLTGLFLAPITRGRLMMGLLLAMLLNRPV